MASSDEGASQRLIVVKLDVTNDLDVNAAYEHVKENLDDNGK